MKSIGVKESNQTYHANKAISKSKLVYFSKTPQYFKYMMENPPEPTDDFRFGSAYHKWCLEPRTFKKEFAVSPIFDKRTKEGKAQFNAFVENSNGKTIITEEDKKNIDDMRKILKADRFAQKLLKNGIAERSFYWTDATTGIDCKCRPDYHCFIGDQLIITDLKTCRSAEMNSIMRDVVNYGYDLQVYMYSKGLSINYQIPLDSIKFLFIFQEKTKPYMINIVEANEFILQSGESKYNEYLATLKYCRETNNWYGYMGKDGLPNELTLPSYLLKDR